MYSIHPTLSQDDWVMQLAVMLTMLLIILLIMKQANDETN